MDAGKHGSFLRTKQLCFYLASAILKVLPRSFLHLLCWLARLLVVQLLNGSACYSTGAAAIYPVAKGPEVRISWIVMRWVQLLCARVSVEGEPEGLAVLPTVVSDRTAMPRSADRHKKTTSRPTQNTDRKSVV